MILRRNDSVRAAHVWLTHADKQRQRAWINQEPSHQGGVRNDASI